MNLILSPKDWTGDVPVLKFDNGSDIESHLWSFLFSVNFENSVVAVFFELHEIKDYRNEHESLLVTTNPNHVMNFVEEQTFRKFTVKSISVFEFSTYKEAFEYCIDLKEGL